MDRILSKGKTQDGLAIVEITTGEKTEKKFFHSVRCGLSWPISNESRGYYCLVGQGEVKLKNGEWPLMVLSEGISLTMENLFENMFNDMGIFGAIDMFVDASKKFQSYVMHLDDYRTKKRPSQSITIQPAPYSQSFIHGFDLIMKWSHPDFKGLTIPKHFLIYEQLRNFKNSELDGDPESKYNAMNGLRYVLGSFEVSFSTNTRISTPKVVPKEAWT